MKYTSQNGGADLVEDHEALPRGGFARFSSSLYEDLINRHTGFIVSIKNTIVVRLAIINFLEKNMTIKAVI